jgi:hypothetical protein
MPRRHGWLHDYEQELDNGSRRMPDGQGQGPSTSPVTINININLGDLIDKLVGGKRSAREALEEMVAAKDGRRLLTEDDED